MLMAVQKKHYPNLRVYKWQIIEQVYLVLTELLGYLVKHLYIFHPKQDVLVALSKPKENKEWQ
jgi:hypothetical protein